MKTRRRKTIERTPEQIALTCTTGREAFKYGENVHRAYLTLHLDKAIEVGIVKKVDKKDIEQEKVSE